MTLLQIHTAESKNVPQPTFKVFGYSPSFSIGSASSTAFAPNGTTNGGYWVKPAGAEPKRSELRFPCYVFFFMEFKEHDEHLLGCDDIALWLSVFVIFEVVVEKVDGSIEGDEKLSKYHGKSSPPGFTTKAPEMLGDNNAVAFSRDTGRLISKTYHCINGLKKFYAFHINYMCQDAVVELGLVGKDGLLFSHKDGNQECCQVRRKMPLWTALKELLPWMTELKHHSQSIGVRNQVTGTTCGLWKWNAVAKVENRECGSFLLATIPLFSCIPFQGYFSILYEPPIRTALPWQGEREGICWWEDVRPRIVVFSRYGRIIKWPLAVPSIQYGNE